MSRSRATSTPPDDGGAHAAEQLWQGNPTAPASAGLLRALANGIECDPDYALVRVTAAQLRTLAAQLDDERVPKPGTTQRELENLRRVVTDLRYQNSDDTHSIEFRYVAGTPGVRDLTPHAAMILRGLLADMEEAIIIASLPRSEGSRGDKEGDG